MNTRNNIPNLSDFTINHQQVLAHGPSGKLIRARDPFNEFFSKPENRDKSPQLFLPWALHIASALEALHEQNLTHGNLSSGNVFINEKQQAILGGFFDQLRLNKVSTETKKTFTKASDIFAFGLTLLEIIVKGTAFEKAIEYDKTVDLKDDETLTQKSSYYIDMINQLPASVPKALCELLKDCLQVNATQRPNANQLVERLAHLNKIEPTHKSKSKLILPEKLYKTAMSMLDHNPKFATLLLQDAATDGFTVAKQQLAEILQRRNPISEYKSEKIKDCKDQSKAHSLPELTTAVHAPKVDPKLPKVSEIKTESKENLRLAFQHFFGLDLLRDLDLSRDFLVKAAGGKSSDPTAQLARVLQSLSTNPLDETCPLRFYVPGNDFKAPFVELEPTLYRFTAKRDQAYRCSIVGRIAVLIAPTDHLDIEAMLKRCAHAHPNVVGPIGITSDVSVLSSTGVRARLPIALLFAPITATLANRTMINDPITACSRFLPFLVGVANGLAHLHKSQVVHGNVSLNYMLVGDNREGLIATGPASCLRASAPESLLNNKITSASDVFQFGMTIAHVLTGDAAWDPNADMDPKTRLSKLQAAAASGFAELRASIPTWCPAPLIDIMMRCLRMEPSQRPTMEAIATELQTLRSTLTHAAATALGPSPNQFWMHTSHICLELTADDPMLRDGGIIECLYGPRIRDRLQQNYNVSTGRSKINQDKTTPGVMHSKSFGTTTGPSSVLAYPNLAENTKKIMEYKNKFFTKSVLASWDGSEVPPRGIRHFPSWARGAILLDNKRLNAYVDRLKTPPCYSFETVWCSGKPDECKCERESRLKNPHIISPHMAPDVLRHISSFLEPTEHGSLSGVSKYANEICEGNINYWQNVIREHADQKLIYIPSDILSEKNVTKKQIDKNETKNKLESKTDIQQKTTEKKHQFDALLRRWAKIITSQHFYARDYTTLQLDNTDVLHIPDITRDERVLLIEKNSTIFKKKTCACGICHECITFTTHYTDAGTKAVGSPFMACSSCQQQNVWNSTEATVLWGFSEEQLDKIPYWRFTTAKRFSTVDLMDFRIKEPMLKCFNNPIEIGKEIWDRYPDLPEYVKQFVIAESAQTAPKTVMPETTESALSTPKLVTTESAQATSTLAITESKQAKSTQISTELSQATSTLGTIESKQTSSKQVKTESAPLNATSSQTPEHLASNPSVIQQSDTKGMDSKQVSDSASSMLVSASDSQKLTEKTPVKTIDPSLANSTYTIFYKPKPELSEKEIKALLSTSSIVKAKKVVTSSI